MLKAFQTSVTTNTVSQKYLKWDPPPVDFLKLDVDGAMFFDQQKAGIGFRDHKGKAVMATSMAERWVANPESIEALAILRSL